MIGVYTPAMDVSSAALEPAFILFTLLIAGLNAWRYTQAAHRDKPDKNNEQHKRLRKYEIENLLLVADGVLSVSNPFYAKLSADGRVKFLKRLRVVLAINEFIGTDGLELTAEKEILAASAIVQVTFGLKKYRLKRFNKIMIHPGVFYNKLLDRNLKGSTSIRGVIRFSWPHLEKGYKIEDDNINLALHEVAHALKLSIEKDAEDKDLNTYLKAFSTVGSPIRSKILSGKLNHLRAYAGTNEHEFFACSVEYFFESPSDFKTNLPELYEAMCQLLNLDPLKVDADYELDAYRKRSRKEVSQQLLEAGVVDDESHKWVGWLMVIGIFGGTIGLYFFISKLEGSVVSILLFLITIGMAGYFLFRRRFLYTGYMDNTSFWLFICTGFVPVAASVLLFVNASVPLYSESNRCDITKIKSLGGAYKVISSSCGSKVLRRGVELSIDPSVVWDLETGGYLIYNTYYGLFGLKVLGEVKAVLP